MPGGCFWASGGSDRSERLIWLSFSFHGHASSTELCLCWIIIHTAGFCVLGPGLGPQFRFVHIGGSDICLSKIVRNASHPRPTNSAVVCTHLATSCAPAARPSAAIASRLPLNSFVNFEPGRSPLSVFGFDRTRSPFKLRFRTRLEGDLQWGKEVRPTRRSKTWHMSHVQPHKCK